MQVFIKQHPRSLLLASDQHVLVVRSLEPRGSVEARVKCAVEFVARREIDLTAGWTPMRAPGLGCLGLINMGHDVFFCTITARSEAASPTPGRTVWRIHGCEFYCITKHNWPLLDPASYGVEPPSAAKLEHPCAGIHKLLTDGSFYYSTDFDLTAMLQNAGDRPNWADPVDASFMWNSYMIEELGKFRGRLPPEEQAQLDGRGFLTCVIRGFCETLPVTINESEARLTVISRQSWHRAGTRYNARGIDDDGNVANFVETETVLWLGNRQQFGYVQLRGSVPVFWEQDNNLLGAKVVIHRSYEATQPAFRRHFENLVDRFGAVHIIDLLSTKQGEAELSEAYREHLNSDDARELKSAVKYTHFDFHKEVATGGGYGAASKIIDRIQESMLEFGFYSYNPQTLQNETEQIGVFRTNCLDCLDRTNLVQQLVSKDALDLFLDYYNIYPTEALWQTHSALWANNGDQLSQIYAGTNALKSSYTRSGKMNFAGAISDVSKSVGRLYVNNFADKNRQSNIEFLLGRGDGQFEVTIYDPINDWVQTELNRRKEEFSTPHQIQFFAGTFNVNGKSPTESDMTPWLFPKEMKQYPDLYMIGLQELVELSPGQILSTDSSRRLVWENVIGETLNKREHYVMLRAGQLVGTGILLFAKSSEIGYITRVEGTSKKTAFGGMAGSKGGVGVSFMYASTSFCFLNSHLAAGQSNLEERHQQYKTLYAGMRFSRGRHIKDHDSVVWLGDFNYRVDLPNDTVRSMIEYEMNHFEDKERDPVIPRLLEYDQLIAQMRSGETFPYFSELDIKFLPTYKYDNNSDVYDTSEKARIPSWTDRILSRGSNLRQFAYNSVQSIRMSDHRPVYALFEASVLIVNANKRKTLYQQLYERRKAQLGDANYLVNDLDLTSATLTTIGLPQPSTDSQKWWLGQKQTSKVPVLPPRPGMVLNPEKVNPFTSDAVKKDDWVDGQKVEAEAEAAVDSRAASIHSSDSASSLRKVPVPAPVPLVTQSAPASASASGPNLLAAAAPPPPPTRKPNRVAVPGSSLSVTSPQPALQPSSQASLHSQNSQNSQNSQASVISQNGVKRRPVPGPAQSTDSLMDDASEFVPYKSLF